MKKKQFMSKLAALTMAAAMGLTAVPATAVFAAPVAASGVVTPVVSDDDTTSTNYKIKNALSSATAERTDGGVLRSDMDPSVVKITNTGTIDSTATAGTAISVSSVAPKLDSTGKNIETPQVQIGVSLTTGTGAAAKSAGSGAITVNAEALTANEKVAIADLVVTANKDGLTYYDNDDAGSIKTKVQSILDTAGNAKTALSLNDTMGAAKAEGDVHLSFTVSNVSVTKPEGNKDGSVTYTVNWTATPYVKSSTGANIVAGEAVTKSTTLTGTIKAEGRKSDSDAFEEQVENAIAATTFTNDDFDTSAGTTLTDGTSGGLAKLKNALRGVDALKDSADWIDDLGVGDVTVSRYTAGKHGTDGSARLTFDTKRSTDVAGQNTAASVTAKVTVKHATSDVQAEVYNAIWSAVEDLKKDSSSIQAAGQSEAAKESAVKAAVKAAIDAKLADTLGTSTTVASEIASYKVETGTYTKSTDTANGSYSFYVVVDSGIKDSDPSKTITWNIGTKATAGDHGVKTDAAAAKAAAFEITGLAKLGKVEATSLTLPATMTYMYGSDGLEIKPTFTPADANKYTIRWTNSNATDFGLYTSTASTATAVTSGTRVSNATVALKTIKSGAIDKTVTTGQTTVTAELIDSDGVVLAKASTVVSIGKGFSDVQNTSFYAYKAINALADAYQWKQTAGTNTSDTTDDRYAEVSSPVIAGKGNNIFDPNGDVTRAEFVTFLYRLAKNDYTYLSAKEKIGQKDPASVGTTTKFTDVSSSAYYAQAVAWASEKGVVSGRSDTTFDPNGKITRSEAVTMIYRLYANGAKYSHRWTFTDVKDGAYYADAVAYAANEGITVGKSDTVFAPKDNVTRAEAAVFIARAEVNAGNYVYNNSNRVTTDQTGADAPVGTASILYGNY